MSLRTANGDRMGYRRGATLFPLGLGIDLRLDFGRVFLPFLGGMLAFAPGSATQLAPSGPSRRPEPPSSDLAVSRVELGDVTYGGFLLPGIGVHALTEEKTRITIAARGVYSGFVVSGAAASERGSFKLSGSGTHGWGAMAVVEVCRDVIGKRRGVCLFLQGTQAYSEGLQHAFAGGLRLVF